MPGLEYNLLIGLIGVQCSNQSVGRIVAKNRTHACFYPELELVALARQLAEERLILPDRLTFVIENGPAAAHPSWIDNRSVVYDRAWFRLDLLLNLAAKSIGVTEVDLDLALLPQCQIDYVGFARECSGENRLPLARIVGRRGASIKEFLHVVHDACARIAQQRRGKSMRIGRAIKAVNLRLAKVSDKANERIAHILGYLTHDCCSADQTQEIETGGCSIAVGVSQRCRLQYAVIVDTDDCVLNGIGCLYWQEILRVVIDRSGIVEWILKSARDIEMLYGLILFLRRRSWSGKIKDAA